MSLAKSKYASTTREYWRACQALGPQAGNGHKVVACQTAARMIHNTARRGPSPLLRRLATARCMTINPEMMVTPARQISFLPEGAA